MTALRSFPFPTVSENFERMKKRTGDAGPYRLVNAILQSHTYLFSLISLTYKIVFRE